MKKIKESEKGVRYRFSGTVSLTDILSFVDIVSKSWNQIESYIFESYNLLKSSFAT